MAEEETTSDAAAAMGAGVGLVAQEDLKTGLDVARTAGELWAAGDVIDLMEMPVLAGFLESRGERLQQVAVDVMLRAARAQAISRAMEAESEAIAELGTREVAEGIARKVASEAMALRIEEVALAGAGLTVRGQTDLRAADMAADATRNLASTGEEEAAVAGAELGINHG